MVDRVAGQDEKRPFRREVTRQQTGGDATALLEKLGVSDLAPATVCSALGHEEALWRLARPMVQGIGEAGRIIDKRLLRPEVDRAVGAAINRDFRIAKRNRTQRGRSDAP